MTKAGGDLSETDTLDELMAMMTARRFRHLPVRDGRCPGRHRLHRRRRQASRGRGGDGSHRHAGLHRPQLTGAGSSQRAAMPAALRPERGHCARRAAARSELALDVVDLALRCGHAALDQRLGAVEIEQAELRAGAAEMTISGGSPASRERAMRSCTMLKASIITREMPGPLPRCGRRIGAAGASSWRGRCGR